MKSMSSFLSEAAAAKQGEEGEDQAAEEEPPEVAAAPEAEGERKGEGSAAPTAKEGANAAQVEVNQPR